MGLTTTAFSLVILAAWWRTGISDLASTAALADEPPPCQQLEALNRQYGRRNAPPAPRAAQAPTRGVVPAELSFRRVERVTDDQAFTFRPFFSWDHPAGLAAGRLRPARRGGGLGRPCCVGSLVASPPVQALREGLAHENPFPIFLKRCRALQAPQPPRRGVKRSPVSLQVTGLRFFFGARVLARAIHCRGFSKAQNVSGGSSGLI